MKAVKQFIAKNPIVFLLPFLPLTLAGELLHWPPLAIFILACAAIIPMAAYIGKATESLAHFTGPRIGGLLNATLGNAAELIITIVAIRAGLLELVKASITGSILGNLLLVMGLSFIVGGVRHGRQTFDKRGASRNAILLVLAVLAMLIPSLFSHSIGPETSPKVEALSLGVAAVMIVLYALGLLDAARSGDTPLTHEPVPPSALPQWSLRTSIIVLVLATTGIVWLSEALVGAVEPVVASLGISEFFLGIILIPIIGNVAEHLVAVQFAGQNKMTLSVEIAVSSSLQIALLVAPLLVFLSLALGHPLTLIFNTFELLALIAGVLIAALVSADGESSWLEGAALIGIYVILGLAFFVLPV
ncbi:MAG: Ca2+:H+ antiporter [Anaerolineaceae bacterium]|nr:MAG: Ca2+:H+ antiporter [Anaerolineaceae bacterium]